uniref:Immunoglobulin C1-set domain-containing protein n=1 Tax=Strix occidentalis caurina TaxID=311401 RepID=A0A8D0FL59_STROC
WGGSILQNLGYSLGGLSAFLVHVASWCPLAANGSALAFDFTILFNKNPLVCYDPPGRRFVPCDRGLLAQVAAAVATGLNNGSAWTQRALHGALHGAVASHIARGCCTRRCTRPVTLHVARGCCRHVAWGVALHVARERCLGPCMGPSGDWTYQTRVTLTVTPRPGDTFTCSVQHVSLAQPLLEDWGPGLSPGLTLKVAMATVVMALGLGFFSGTLGSRDAGHGQCQAQVTPGTGDTGHRGHQAQRTPGMRDTRYRGHWAQGTLDIRDTRYRQCWAQVTLDTGDTRDRGH